MIARRSTRTRPVSRARCVRATWSRCAGRWEPERRPSCGPPVEHVDLYRIERDEELSEIAFDEAFEPDAIVFVEWPERAESRLPPGRFEVAIAGAGDGPRTVRIERRLAGR